MKDSAIQSTPALSAASRSERSFGVSALKPMVVSGTLTPLRSESLVPTSTTVSARVLVTLGDAQPHLAVVEQQPVADLERGEDFRMGQFDAAGVAGLGVESSTKVWPGVSVTLLSAKVPMRSFGSLQDRRECRSAGLPRPRPRG